ncbi:CAMK/CAMKL/MARK protein kinase [Coprinopsis cinerea okayama7|uniref:CAMK/CAMKL/MARK protein kinase n=1 Tax=Coprinopsis cinerea (strain Okayama-7 / 130 / ATCC MYA-4618 / FGSC 9003) TaxID=240176 RepID=A8NRN0_COPC7|nr:CAMK/CAMKL/MARK protein kinase [Coprinopsis cinerea okayama7\|eukprot:XP_001835812.2 CAMK/CAMKL/MARK protein kinase [Coprinopsis cinerea okayama7\
MDSSSSSRTNSPTSPLEQEPNDVFSIDDDTVSAELDFVEEIGNGNWGSVWLVRPKRSRPQCHHPAFKVGGRKFAVKLVHRDQKSPANASRIKSLWNEMKIVRSFRADQHPSIIAFHSFVVSVKYAMITMTYLPTPMPVEVQEVKAREWFRFLLSAVDFLHRRGVVHNDIKPANILLSHKNIPVLVDFGFAEKNDPEDETSFHSNLAYGTPEYLSPERARGLTHDTRKSDVWSLGVTFFEILNGRTPFEEFDGESLSTKEAVERYWARTLRGKWVGTWDVSPGMEKLLRRMICPNADLRCTAAHALADRYWSPGREESKNTHRRSASEISSIVFEKDLDKLLNMTPPRSRRTVDASENPVSPPGLALPQDLDSSTRRHSLVKSKSQPKVTASNIQPRRRPAPPVIDLSPIKASPPASPYASASAKENMAAAANRNRSVAGHKENKHGTASSRRAFGAIIAPDNNTIMPPPPLSTRIPIKTLDEMTSRRRSGLFDSTRSRSNLALSNKTSNINLKDGDRSLSGSLRANGSNNVKDRVLEWEREKQRLREMERLEELERERDEHFEREKARRKEKREKKEEENKEDTLAAPPVTHKRSKKASADAEGEKENMGASKPGQKQKSHASPPTLPLPPVMSPLSRMLNTFPAPTPNNTVIQSPPAPQPAKQSRQNIFKHSIKASIDKTVQFCKAPSIGRAAGSKTGGGSTSATPGRGFSFDIVREVEKAGAKIRRESRDEPRTSKHREEVSTPLSPNIGSVVSPITPLGPIKNAAMMEQAAAETQMDRMAIWMKNVKEVVEETQANFEAMAPQEFSLPPLPVPLPRSQSRQNRSSRLPRRVLAASQIFDENGQPSTADSSFTSNKASMTSSTQHCPPPPPSAYTGPGTPRRISGSSGPSQEISVHPHASGSPLVSAASSNFVIPEIVTPSKQKRRATVSTRSPEPLISAKFADNVDYSASTSNLNIAAYVAAKRNQSQSTLTKLGITPLGLDPDHKKSSETLIKLSDVDRSLFVPSPFVSQDNLLDNSSFVFAREPSYDDLTGSPCHVEAYPSRNRPSKDVSYMDTPNRLKMENVYDRFLMTSGVKRCGKGYQSESFGPTSNTLGPSTNKRESFRPFSSTRKPMPPPVSSEDIIEKMENKAVSVDELGMMTNVEGEAGTTPLHSVGSKDEGGGTVAMVRRAFKAMVPGKAVVSKRTSKVY